MQNLNCIYLRTGWCKLCMLCMSARLPTILYHRELQSWKYWNSFSLEAPFLWLLFKFDLMVWLHLQVLKVTSLGRQEKSIFLFPKFTLTEWTNASIVVFVLKLETLLLNKYNCQSISWNGLPRRCRNARIIKQQFDPCQNYKAMYSNRHKP